MKKLTPYERNVRDQKIAEYQANLPQMLCIDCGHVGPAAKPVSNGLGGIGEVLVFGMLLLCGIIPGLIYAIYVNGRTKNAKNQRFCGKCRSTQIQIKPAS